MKKQPKKHSLSYWKKRAWAECSVYVRTKSLDKHGKATCYTCGIKKPWKKMYAGHFVQGRRPSILFELAIIKPQCVGCNRFRHGNLNVFTPKMINEIGLDACQEFWKLAEQSVERNAKFYEKLYERFKFRNNFLFDLTTRQWRKKNVNGTLKRLHKD